MKNQLSSINARVYREHEKPTVPAGTPYASAGLLPGAREVDLLAENARLIGVIQSHADAGLVAQTALRAENARLRAALTSFIETWDALPDECRRAANGATNFGRLITTLRAALLGKEGAC